MDPREWLSRPTFHADSENSLHFVLRASSDPLHARFHSCTKRKTHTKRGLAGASFAPISLFLAKHTRLEQGFAAWTTVNDK